MLKVKELKLFCKLAELPCSGNKGELLQKIEKYLKKYKFAPRYLRGLSKEEKFQKKFEIKFYQLLEKKKRVKTYSPTQLDISKKNKKVSSYTERWNKAYPKAKSISQKSKISGISPDILKEVYNRGLAAWRGSSHRPGATQHQWGVSRVNSFLTCGKTWEFPDHKLAIKALENVRVKKFWKSCDKKRLGKKTKSR